MTSDKKKQLLSTLDDLEGRIVSLMVRIEKMDEDPADFLCDGCKRQALTTTPDLCHHCCRYYPDRYEDEKL